MGLLDRIRSAGPPPIEARPLTVTGRGHVDGFLQMEELNVDLVGRAGLEIYDRMYRTDGDVRQVLHLLANPIIAGTWEVIPAGGPTADQDAIDDAEFVRWALFENMSPNLRGHLWECLPVLFRSGFAPFEKVWEVAEYNGQSVTVPRGLQLRLPRTIYRWKQDEWGGLEAIQQYLPVPRAQVVAGPNVIIPGDPVLANSGTEDPTGRDDASVTDSTIITDTRMPDYRQTVWLPTSNLIYYRIGAEGDNWEGVSLLRPAYKHWIMKDAIERMDAIAQEKEALGIPVCYPPLGATPDQFEAVEIMLAGIRANTQGYILMPGPKASGTGTSGQGFGQGWLIEYLKPGEHGSGRDPQPSLSYHTDKISAAFIAEFIRIGHSLTGGNRDIGETQMDPFLVGVEAITGLIEDIINDQLVAPIVAYNRPNAKAMPRLKMSLVDAATLSQIADFCLKLIQVGAMIPDQPLEDFLRARADLPPADSLEVEERGDLDGSLRREILMGKNGGGGAPAGTNGPAGSTTGGSADGSKGVDNKDKSSQNGNGAPAPAPTPSAHEALVKKAMSGTTLSADDYVPMPRGNVPAPAEAPHHGTEPRVRWRPQAPYELSVDLDRIEDHFDSAPARLMSGCDVTMCQLARDMAENYPTRVTEHPELQSNIQRVLDDAYDFGAQTVSEEIQRHTQGLPYQLAAATGRNRARNEERAAHGTMQVVDAMHHAIAHAHMQGDPMHRKQRSAEKAGAAAMKSVARAHVASAFNQGRSDRLLDAADGDPGIKWGVRYTAILDKNTCGNCRDADDGVIRSLDDPVRLENQPPNPHCDSTEGLQGNQCRCFEIPMPMDGLGGS